MNKEDYIKAIDLNLLAVIFSLKNDNVTTQQEFLRDMTGGMDLIGDANTDKFLNEYRRENENITPELYSCYCNAIEVQALIEPRIPHIIEDDFDGVLLTYMMAVKALISDIKARFPSIPMPNVSNGRSSGESSHSLIDKNELKKLFQPVFQDKSFATNDTPTGSEKISRFDQFCSRLEMTLNDKKPTQKLIGEIAYLIYTSRYVDNKLKKPQKEGKKGVFTDLLKAFNKAINMKDFYLQPAKCCNPSDELKATFNMLQ